MDSSWLQTVLEWIEMHPQTTGWMIFIVALGESLLLVGILLPGAALLVGLGTLIGLGVVDFKLAWIAASLGAFIGDGISFWIGHHYKEKLLKMWPMYKFPTLIDQGQSFFSKWGTLSVFIGRFVGLVRPIIPAIAGIMAMPIKKYLIISTVAAILWAPFYLLPGMLFGSAMGSMAKVAGKLALLLVILVLTIALIYWVIQQVYALLFPRAHRLLSKVLVWSQKHPTLGKITSGLVDPRQPEKGSLAFIASFTIALSIVSLIVILNSDTITHWSMYVHQFMQAFHTDWTEPVMLFILALNHDLSILISTIAVLLWLLKRKRKVAALHWIFIVASSYALSLSIDYFSATQPRPWYGFHHLAWFVAVTAYWSAFITGTLPHRIRTWPYTLATVLIAVVSFTQLFFAQMRLAEVVISVLSGAFLAAVVAIAFRMRQRQQLLGWPVSSIFFSAQTVMVIVALIFLSQDVLKERQMDLASTTSQAWLKTPVVERQDWLNRSKQKFTINFHGNIEQLNKIMSSYGFSSRSPKPWMNIWQALNHDQNSESITVIPTTHEGKTESLILANKTGDSLLTLHLWQKPLIMPPSDALVYSGYVSNNQVNEKFGLTFWKNTNDSSAQSQFMQIITNDDRITVKTVNEQLFITINT